MRNGFTYTIRYTKIADKFFSKHEEVRILYEKTITELMLGEHPERIDVKRIRGKRNDYYRIRLGNYRVIYTIINGTIVAVETLLAGSRGDLYKKLESLD